MNIPLAHVQGGEVTGSIDEKVRHAVTKLADLHFVSTEQAARAGHPHGRGARARCIVTGCPSIDLAAEVLREPDARLRPVRALRRRRRPSSTCRDGYLVVMQHPVTTEYDEAPRSRSTETLQAVARARPAGAVVLAQRRRRLRRHLEGHPRVPRAASARPTSTSSRTWRPRTSCGCSSDPACLVGNSSVGHPRVLVPRRAGGQHRHPPDRARARPQRHRRGLRPDEIADAARDPVGRPRPTPRHAVRRRQGRTAHRRPARQDPADHRKTPGLLALNVLHFTRTASHHPFSRIWPAFQHSNIRLFMGTLERGGALQESVKPFGVEGLALDCEQLAGVSGAIVRLARQLRDKRPSRPRPPGRTVAGGIVGGAPGRCPRPGHDPAPLGRADHLWQPRAVMLDRFIGRHLARDIVAISRGGQAVADRDDGIPEDKIRMVQRVQLGSRSIQPGSNQRGATGAGLEGCTVLCNVGRNAWVPARKAWMKGQDTLLRAVAAAKLPPDIRVLIVVVAPRKSCGPWPSNWRSPLSASSSVSAAMSWT